jgi:serine phosphatase RsbU (regulator of sigma subunit)/class 3 adenylate cyclase/tetratricopeptide (TPR) repeat protein
MNCPVCHTHNSPGARFCLNCGSPLSLTCTQCGASLPPNAHFCMRCGQAVEISTKLDTDLLDRLAAATPASLAAKVRATEYIAGEQRVVTALFLDVADSTSIIQTLGENGWSTIINEAFNHFYPVIYRFEGTIVRVQNDTLLAFFGAPLAHEDDPLRALNAAFALIEATEAFASEIAAPRGVSFAVRIGLSTGPLVVNSVHNDLKFDYEPVGNLINLASRVQTLVPPNGIAATEQTHHSLAHLVESTMYCMVAVEGEAAPLCVYRLLRMVNHTDQLRSLHGLESPLVGRSHELGTLLNVVEMVRAGLGRAVLVIGEPGIGKTRLIDEWRAAAIQGSPDYPLQWYRARSQSYDRNTAYHLLDELLFAILGLPSSSANAETLAALQTALEVRFPKASEAFPYLAHLLALPLSGEGTGEHLAALSDLNQSDYEKVRYLDPPSLHTRYLAAIQILLQSLAEQSPVVLVLEDLHWADPSSVAIFSRLLPLARTAPLLFCLTTRSDSESPGWELVNAARDLLGDGLTVFTLPPLAEVESRQLLENLLPGETLPETVRQSILSSSEGNPLFIEEIIRMMIGQEFLSEESGTWLTRESAGDLLVPTSLQGLLLARVDRLPPDSRTLLRVASVIGRSFPLSLLEKVMGDGSLTGKMSALETAGLLRVTQVKPELAYTFRHALVHEAVYASLLPEDRRQLHLAVGEALENLYPHRYHELSPRLAFHFNSAGDPQRALQYYIQAGDAAMAAFANQEAEDHFRTALSLCQDIKLQADLQARLGEVFFNQGRYTNAIAEWQQSRKLYETLGDLDAQARLAARAARAAWHAGDAAGGLAMCEQALHAIGAQDRSPGVAALLHETARARYFNAQFDQLAEMCQQALDIATRAGDLPVQADTLATLGLLPDQPPELAISSLQRAVDLAEENNLLTIAARAHTNLGTTLVRLKGDLRKARKHYSRAAEIQHLRGSVSDELYARLSIADVSFSLGELSSVEEALHGMKSLQELAPDPELPKRWLKVFEARLMASRGDWQQAAPLLRTYREEARQLQDQAHLGDINRSLGWALLELVQWQVSTDTDEALQLFQEALEAFSRSVKPTVSLHCLLVMLHTERGELELAQQHLDTARQKAGSSPIPLEGSWIFWAQAILDRHHKRWESALNAFQMAVGQVIPVGLRWHWARLLKDWAETHILRGEYDDLEQAQLLLRQSEELFKQLGAPEYAHRVATRILAITQDTMAEAAAHRLVSRELALAGRVQESFLPQAPRLPGNWEISATLKPARETSGDFYDFIPLPGDKLGLLIGDVADKGVGAALFMTLSRTLIRTYAGDYPDRPEEVFAAANRRILEDSTLGLFVTAFYGVLDLRSGDFHYVNAGHNPPYLLPNPADGGITELIRTGVPLGVFKEAVWGAVQIRLEPGDTLVMYTDGATETQNSQDEFYGEIRLKENLQRDGVLPGKSAHDLQEDLLADIQHFMEEQPRLDDLAMIVLKRAK